MAATDPTPPTFMAEALTAIDAAGQALKAKLDELWVPYDPATGTGGLYWHATASSLLLDGLKILSDLEVHVQNIDFPGATPEPAVEPSDTPADVPAAPVEPPATDPSPVAPEQVAPAPVEEPVAPEVVPEAPAEAPVPEEAPAPVAEPEPTDVPAPEAPAEGEVNG